jgi:deoxyribodipyrimidine photo-lyase
MNQRHEKTLFIFRRDLRLVDNTGLSEACRLSNSVLPCFIFDPEQIERNAYRSDCAVRFMKGSLEELDKEIRAQGGRLYYFAGKPSEVVAKLVASERIDAVFVNRDYTPYSVNRDDEIRDVCVSAGVRFYQFADALLHEPEQVLKDDGKPYTVFTPFARKASTFPVPLPRPTCSTNFNTGEVTLSVDAIPFDLSLRESARGAIPSGRKAGVRLIERISELGKYEKLRDFPATNGTSGLSAHNKFGTVSIREVYHAVVQSHGEKHRLVGELLWRDFFTHIASHFPHVFKGTFHRKFDRLAWSQDECAFQRWREGTTGFPIVDAGMRQLNATGFMHNRVRMIVASFLVKDLHIDWRWGEKYFAQRLVDYDPSVNNGNWQWAASTGCDAVPYFRVFNPWLQQKRFDPEAVYIRTWVEELKEATVQQIHGLESGSLAGYPKPMVDHRREAERAKLMFAQLNLANRGEKV